MTAQEREVESTVRDLLRAASAGDADAVADLVSNDLLLYKVGRVRGRSDMLAAVHEFATLGGSAHYELSEMVTRIDGRLAVMTFRSRAEIELPGEATRRPRWLESVVLQRTDRWRIIFYHSTDEVEAEPRRG